MTRRYDALVASGALRADGAQAGAAAALGAVVRSLASAQAAADARLTALQERDAEVARRAADMRAREAAQAAKGGGGGGMAGRLASLLGAGKLGAAASALGLRAPPQAGRLDAPRERKRRALAAESGLPALPPPPAVPPGLYLHGPVGTGKTMLMDLALQAAREDGRVRSVSRVHFNEWSLALNASMHAADTRLKAKAKLIREAAARQEEEAFEAAKAKYAGGTDDAGVGGYAAGQDTSVLDLAEIESLLEEDGAYPYSFVLDAVADEMAGGKDAVRGGKFSVLCFDEMQVTDIFTAAAVSALMPRLFERGVLMVATSNRPPADLVCAGEQVADESRFSVFINELQARAPPHEVTTSDFRREAAARALGGEAALDANAEAPLPRFLHPRNCRTHSAFEAAAKAALAADESGEPEGAKEVDIMFGRSMTIPRAKGRVGVVDFSELCAQSTTRGAADYIALCSAFDVLLVDGVPSMGIRSRDIARRFITLIDEAYNAKVALIARAAAPPAALFAGLEDADHALVDLEQLQFEGDVEGARSRRDLTKAAPTAELKAGAASHLGGQQEKFAFGRAVSRLLEMQTPAYTALGRGGKAAEAATKAVADTLAARREYQTDLGMGFL